MRLVLIDPPFYRFMGFYTRYFPYGLATLAAWARALGHEAFVLDADHDPGALGVDYQGLPAHHPRYLAGVADPRHPVWHHLRATLERIQPDWVGITALTAKMASVVQTASVVRACLPHVPIVVGGPHAMAAPREVLANAPEVDAVVVGEGEEVLAPLLALGRDDLAGCPPIPGVLTRTSSEPSESPPTEPRHMLPPARTSLVRGSYSREDLGLVMTSRGCPHSCAYCFRGGLWCRTVRFVPLETLHEEISWLHRQGVRHLTFKDDVFTLHRARTLDLCHLLAERRMTWDCVTRADRLDEDLLATMKRSGCIGIKIGVESGSDRVVEMLHRSLDLDTIRRAARLLRSSGIHWTAYFMMGLPGETLEDVEQTYRFMRELSPDFASLSGFEAFPGTALFRRALAMGVVKETLSREELFRVSPHDYYFTREDRGMVLPSGLSYRALERSMQARFHRYNASLPRLSKRFASRLRVWRAEPTRMLQDAQRLVVWMGGRIR